MRGLGQRLQKQWLPVSIAIGSALVLPIAASSGQISYRAYLTASLTVRSSGAQLSVSRTTAGSVASPGGVTINSHGDAPYTLFLEQNRANANASAALEFCRDPACTTVWAPDGDPQTGILVTPGSGSTALPLSVIRPAKAADDGDLSDVVMLTMYF